MTERSEARTGDFSADWLRLREPADAHARAADLVDLIRPGLARPIVVRDLGCGTGSLGRWLAPRLPGPQHWVLVDRDPALLDRAAATLPRYAADGAPVTVEARLGDVTALSAADLTGTSLVTCSALLDLLTADEVEAIAAALAAGGTPALFTLSVSGEVRFDPPDPLDAVVAAAFDEHQRRTVTSAGQGSRTSGPGAGEAGSAAGGARRLLGTDAPVVTEQVLTALGGRVTVRPSPWRLGPDRAQLAAAWLHGWLAAAVEQQPELRVDAYRERRLAGLAAGAVTVTVGHRDLLARFR